MTFLQRYVYHDLRTHLKAPEISLILGPRQAGKTTIMRKLSDDCQKMNRPAAFFNLDVIEDRQYFATQHTLLAAIRRLRGAEPAVVFIDEIQRLNNAGLFLKGLYDLNTGHKFIVSGSGSLELKADVIEPMTGRKKIFYCLPLSFSEFAAHRLQTELDAVPAALSTNPYETDRVIREYLAFGGYPRVVLAAADAEKTAVLSEIFHSYLEKDIQLMLGIEKADAFQRLVQLLAHQVSGLVNKNELSSTLGLNIKTVEKYLYFLEKTFVISGVKPFFRNARKELRKAPKLYFLDLGFLRLGLGGQTEPTGPVFENACFLRLMEQSRLIPLHYWRSTSGAEVDFIVETGEDPAVPVEIKYKKLVKPLLTRSFRSFVSKYRPKHGYVIHLGDSFNNKLGGTTVHFLPYWQLLTDPRRLVVR